MGLSWWKVKLPHVSLTLVQVSLLKSEKEEWQADAGGRGCNRRPERD